MMTATGPFELEPQELLQHDEWLRRLARSLVHGADVDDLVQDAWAAAVVQRPDGDRPLRGWLATVVRRLAARHRRTAVRRSAREAGALPPEQLPSTEATVAVLELQRRVSAAVAAMAEPYRTAILLRFYHGLSNAQIAAREQVRDDAVRKRVERGLEHLRAQLRERHGADWRRTPAVIALAGPAAVGKAAIGITGVLLMSKSMKLALAAMLLAMGGVTVWWLDPPTAPATPSPPLPPAVAATAGDRMASAAAARAETPAAASESARVRIESPAQHAAAAPANCCSGHVFDAQGRPLADVPLVTEGTKVAVGTSAADGSFDVVLDRYSRLLAGDGYVTLRTPPTGWLRHEHLVLVATKAVDLAGEIVDELGERVGEVHIEARAPALADFPLPLDDTCAVEPQAMLRFGNAGTRLDRSVSLLGEGPAAARVPFAIVDLPPGGVVAFECDGHEPAQLAVPAASATGLRVVLARNAGPCLVLQGRVLDERELAVAGASVGLGRQSARTDADGRFRLVFQRQQDAPQAVDALFAAHPGHQTLVLEGFGARARDEARRDLVLQLPGAALSIAGRVVDATGSPLTNAQVYPWNEPMLDGGTAEELAQPEDGPVHYLGLNLRGVATTDTNGVFTLGGLRARDYRLHVLLTDRRAGFTSGPIAAGTAGVELRAPTELVYERVAGRYVTRDGRPVAGVLLSPSLAIFVSRNKGRWGDGRPGTTTDADGRFELRDVPCADFQVGYSGDDILPGFATIDPRRPILEQQIVVARRCHLRVEVDPSRGVQSFGVLDAGGKALPIFELAPGSSRTTTQFQLQDGRSGVLSVSEDGVTVVLANKNGEVARLPLRLCAREVAVVRY
jgi:RNA polymerase sigma factor (sigma-70 family)